MQLAGVLPCVLILLALAVCPAHADDPCYGEEEKKTALARSSAWQKAEQANQPAALFVASLQVIEDLCMDRYDKNLLLKVRANMPKLGRDLAKASETKGILYSNEPIRADGQTSAFRYLETIGDQQEANRVLLKAVQAKPDDLKLFEAAWNIDHNRYGPVDPNTGSRSPYTSPPSFRHELETVASVNADRLMKAEEKDAQGLSGSAFELNKVTSQSLEKLRTAAAWMKYLPSGDKPAKDRAEQRGDTIMKRPDPMFSQSYAKMYYGFSGSPKAKEMAAQIERKGEQSQRALEKAGASMKNAFTEKSAAEQKEFEKKKADLEKELGF